MIPETTHHLAAIMFTDIQGYTALMQEDEEQAVNIRAEHRKIFKTTTQKYHGEILQYYGDGTLSIFDSAIEAVKCGIEMQLDFPIPVRIGIHTGEIIHDNEEIIGDGVNIASHIESLAVVGSVFVSEKVYDEIKNQKSIKTQSIGSFKLKNIENPIDVFAISNDGLVVPFRDQVKGRVIAETEVQPKVIPGFFKSFPGKLVIPGMLILIILSAAIYFYVKGGVRGFGSGVTIDRSIAIVPFVNLSNDPEQDYFSDGITEDILTQISKIGDLRVISRSSVMRYKNTNLSTKEIAKELGVNHILEGSVRKYGDKVRIAVQLIDAKTDNYLWTEIFDRDLQDIFSVQSEVAKHIASSLQITISSNVKERIEIPPTSNTEAYDLFLRARFLLSYGANQKSRGLLEEAIALDPDYAPAYAELGLFWLGRGAWIGDISGEKAVEQSLPYLNKALELDRNYPYTHVYLAWLYTWYKWDFQAAEKEFHTALELAPSDASIMLNPVDLLLALGKYDQAFEKVNLAIKSDPMTLYAGPSKGLSLYFLNQPEEAIKTFQEALRLNSNPILFNTASRTYLYLGLYKEVIATINRYLELYPESNFKSPRTLGIMAIAYYKLGQHDKMQGYLDEIKQKGSKSAVGSPSFYIAMIYAQMGEKDLAFKWLDKSYQDREVEMYWLKVEPPFKPLNDDARWQEMLDKVGFPD